VGLLLLAPRVLAPARAQTPSAPALSPAAPATPAKKAKTYHVKAGHVEYDGAKKVYHFTTTPAGNVVFTQEDVTMSMDQCEYDDDHQTGTGGGHLKLTDPESTITGDRLDVNFDQKLAHIIGNVTIVTQKKKKEEAAKPAAGEQKEGMAEYREKKTTITCTQIDYYYADDKKQATVVGPVKAVQDDKTVTSEKAFYDGVKDEVTLDGNVHLSMENGSQFGSPKLYISLKDNSFHGEDLQGIAVEEEKPKPATPPAGGETKPAPSAPAAPPAPPASGAGHG